MCPKTYELTAILIGFSNRFFVNKPIHINQNARKMRYQVYFIRSIWYISSTEAVVYVAERQFLKVV